MTRRAPVPVAVLDLRALIGFLRSVALSIEIQANTHVEWKKFTDSTALNVAYALLPWKEAPGTAELTQDWRRIRQNTQQRTESMLRTFLDRLHSSGPMSAALYVEQMEKLGAGARRAIHELFADAQNINLQVAGQAGQAARNLAVVQFGCTVLLAATGCYVALGGAVPAVMVGSMTPMQMTAGVGVTNLAYNITGALVKDAVSWKSAKVIAIETGKDRGGGAATTWLLSRETAAARELGAQQTILDTAEANVARYTEKLGGKLGEARRARYARGLARSTTTAEAARARMALGRTAGVTAKAAGKAIPVVFLAHDLYNAWGDLSETWAATR